MWVKENPATGLLTRPFMASALDGRDCKHGTTESRRSCGPTCAGGRGEACAGLAAAASVAGRQAPPGRAAGAAADGGAVREG